MKGTASRYLESAIEKQIFSFLQQNSTASSLPPSLQEHSVNFPFVVLNNLIPILQSVEAGIQQKQAIAFLLQKIILNSQQFLKRLTNSLREKSNEKNECSSNQTFSMLLIKLINLPNHYLNLISQPQLNQQSQLHIGNLESYKQLLYSNILLFIKSEQKQDKLLILNKLIVLGYHKIVVTHFINQQQTSFLLDCFQNLSKPNQLILFLYEMYLKESTQQQIKQKSEENIKQLLKSIAKQYKNSYTSFLSILNTHQLTLFSEQNYQHYFELISDTNIQEPILLQLLKWWAVSRNYIVTDNHAKIRCNILCLLLKHKNKQQLVNSDYPASVLEGIKKRLTDGKSKNFALLAWKTLAEIIDLPLTEEVKTAQFFTIQCQKLELDQQKMHTQQNKMSEAIKPTATKMNEQKIEKQKSYQRKQDQSNQQSNEQSQQEAQFIQIEPKNIYDCILGLRNPVRTKAALKKLPHLVHHHQEDLVLMWNSLLQTLLNPLREQYKHVLVTLFTTKPQEFIEALTLFFMSKQTNVAQKIWLIQILIEGIEQLSTLQQNNEQQDSSANFYFKKVKSTYLTEKKEDKPITHASEQQKQQRTRRWGHTRIEHQRKSKGVNLLIVNQNYINRFYPIANLLYYKVIDILSLDLINSLRKHQILVQHLLRLLSIFTSNIKNHLEKNMLLFDISLNCLRIIEQLFQAKSKPTNPYEQNGGQTMMLCLQVVNKISLVLDQFVSQNVMGNLKNIIETSRKLPNYGMNSILDMIEATIYRTVYQPLKLAI